MRSWKSKRKSCRSLGFPENLGDSCDLGWGKSIAVDCGSDVIGCVGCAMASYTVGVVGNRCGWLDKNSRHWLASVGAAVCGKMWAPRCCEVKMRATSVRMGVWGDTCCIWMLFRVMENTEIKPCAKEVTWLSLWIKAVTWHSVGGINCFSSTKFGMPRRSA